MRLVVILPLIGCAALLVPLGHFTTSDAEYPTERAAASNASGLILQQSEGERRVRRPRPSSGAPMAAPSMIIKVDGRKGGSPDFFVGYEEVAPGSAIPAHSHPEYDEVLLVHQGKGLATLARSSGSSRRALRFTYHQRSGSASRTRASSRLASFSSSHAQRWITIAR
jgi:hypothetical protein